MDKFKGTLDELKERVKACGAEGDWEELSNGHQFRCKDGAKFNWYPTTGKVQFQGSKEASMRLREALGNGATHSAPPAPAVSVPTAPAAIIQ
jgi:hypothetical protein